jgi:chorismate synthase
MLRFLDAGESHGKALTAIIEGLPSNFSIDEEYINKELLRRQGGYGRGTRMKIEQDKVEIWSGVRGKKTTGSPVTLVIPNKDYDNWKSLLQKESSDENRITIPRPGHGDLVGYFKYNTGDIRDVIERTSARETAIRTAVGAVCKLMLNELEILVRSKVSSIGAIQDVEVDIFQEEVYNKIEESPVRCYNSEIEEKIIKEIDRNKEEGDTIGGTIALGVKNLPLGIGSFAHYDRKLDAILSFAVMSVQGIKAVEFGKGLSTDLPGSSFNDEIFYEEGNILRKTNNSGGIEAGVSNGKNIEFKAYMKPIPSIKKSIASIDLKTNSKVSSRYERSDVCAVVPASIVLENVVAFEILKELLKKFTCDDFNELKNTLKIYRDKIQVR